MGGWRGYGGELGGSEGGWDGEGFMHEENAGTATRSS